MPTLRINQQPGSGENRYRIELSAQDVPGFQPDTVDRDIEFVLSPQERESIRWYLEDFLQFDQDPAPKIAKEIEALMADRGEDLFRAILEGSRGAIQLWTTVQPHLSSTRIEVTTEIAEATAIPWELIRDPETKTILALSSESFVRTQRGPPPRTKSKLGGSRESCRFPICRSSNAKNLNGRSITHQEGLSTTNRSKSWIGSRRKPDIRRDNPWHGIAHQESLG